MTSTVKTVIFVLLVFVAIWYGLSHINDLTRQLEDQKAITNQNSVAYEQLLKQKADSIQDMAVIVSSLNDSISKEQRKKGFWRGIASDLQLKVDSIRSSGTATTALYRDSSGEYLQTDFNGKKGILTYSGWTKHYVLPLDTSFHLLTAVFDDIEVQSELYYDVDDLWKIRTVSRTEGVKLKTSHTIDSTIFVGLRRTLEGNTVTRGEDYTSFGIRLKGNVGVKKDDLVHKQFGSLFLDASAEGFYKHYNVTYYPFAGIISGGLVQTLDIGKFINRIF